MPQEQLRSGRRTHPQAVLQVAADGVPTGARRLVWIGAADGSSVVRGRNPVVLADQVVEIEDGVIRGVRRRSPTDVPDTDLGDVTLLPGLVDAHQHLVLDASDDPVTSPQGLDDDDLLIRMSDAAPGSVVVARAR